MSSFFISHGLYKLFAQTVEPGISKGVAYEFARLSQYDDNRIAIAAIGLVALFLMGILWWLYRRDTLELPKRTGIILAALRSLAFAGLLLYFMGFERRDTREVVHNSQVALLIDSSQSMSLPADDSASENEIQTRIDKISKTISESQMLDSLRVSHEVSIAKFDRKLQELVSLPKTNEAIAAPSSPTRTDIEMRQNENEASTSKSSAEWIELLRATGTETRVGDALHDQLRISRNAPLAAIVLVSDGAQNAGIEPESVIAEAAEAGVKIFTVGIGSVEPLRNLSLSDVDIPARAFPTDTVNITAYIQASGYSGRYVNVQLLRRRHNELAGANVSVATERIQVGEDGENVPVSFEIEPGEAGRFVFEIVVDTPADDGNPRDNSRESEMDVVDRETRVLLVASGPTRDYRFLRDQLHRDATMKLDVLLQSNQGEISQDADKILVTFPSSREELFQYDCIVAFDPDWTELDAAQVELVEQWIAEEAGGLIVEAGPIHTARWIRSTEHASLRNIYPVVFQQRLTLLDDGQYGSEEALPLEFDRAGREARFLWLAKSLPESQLAWSEFPGMYGYFAVQGEKPGASVYARVNDPESSLGDANPVYMAGHFYGAGQVFYLGSGELWRLRSLDPAYFEVLLTKLVRHVSQGRLLRGSSRGALMVERDRYELGETILVRARLSDARHEPLTLPSITAQVIQPGDTNQSIALRVDKDRPGMYVGQFSANEEGTYQIALPIPGSSDEPLTHYLQVRLPDLERAHSQRNVKLLTSIAQGTAGKYYSRLEDAVYGSEDSPPLSRSIPSKAETKLIKGAPDQRFAELQRRGLLGVIAGALFLEWVIRRLNRLA